MLFVFFWLLKRKDFISGFFLFKCIESIHRRLQNGLINSLPFLLAFISMNVSGFIADYLVKHRIMRKIVVRKLFSGLGWRIL
jgi:hypothetical protein